MSPWSIIVETFRVTLKPLWFLAAVMAVIMLLPDSSSAAAPPPAEGARRAAILHRPASQAVPPAPRHAQPLPISTITLTFDLSRLPPSAFGDDDDAAR